MTLGQSCECQLEPLADEPPAEPHVSRLLETNVTHGLQRPVNAQERSVGSAKPPSAVEFRRALLRTDHALPPRAAEPRGESASRWLFVPTWRRTRSAAVP